MRTTIATRSPSQGDLSPGKASLADRLAALRPRGCPRVACAGEASTNERSRGPHMASKNASSPQARRPSPAEPHPQNWREASNTRGYSQRIPELLWLELLVLVLEVPLLEPPLLQLELLLPDVLPPEDPPSEDLSISRETQTILAAQYLPSSPRSSRPSARASCDANARHERRLHWGWRTRASRSTSTGTDVTRRSRSSAIR